MRIDTVKRDVTSSGNTQVAKATIKATPKIFDMFANDTYANKPVAIMRELVANAVDAHVAAGKPDTPVRLSLPTELEPVCRVRDYGIGMSQKFVMGPFMAYTDGSTKDQDDTAIGGFGIGSKSPFAYVDQFTLRVVHDGQISIYTMFKDEDGIPAVALQSQASTDEGNGVEVSFPVELDDIETFREAAQEALQYFTPLPDVRNGEVKPPKYNYVGKGWALRSAAGELGVIMGGVRYPVTQGSLSYETRHNSGVGSLLGYGIDITVPIGTCAVAMSREQLSYNARTNEGIATALLAVIDNVTATFATLFDKCPTLWEARKMLFNETDNGNSYGSNPRAELMRANAKYRGEDFKFDFRPDRGSIRGEIKNWIIDRRANRRGVNCPVPRWEDGLPVLMAPGRIEHLIIDNMEPVSKNRAASRIRHFVDEQCDQEKAIYVIRCPDSGVTELLKQLGDPPSEDYSLSENLPLPPKKIRAKNARPRVRMFTYDGGNDRFTHKRPATLSPSYSKDQVVTEIQYAAQPSSGIVVPMNNFVVGRDVYEALDAKVIDYDEVHFVNSSDVSKLDEKDWLRFDDVKKQRLDKALSAYPELGQRIALQNDVRLAHYFGEWREMRRFLPFDQLTDAQKKRPFGRMAALFEEYIAPLNEEQLRLAPFIKSELPARVDPEKLVNALKAKQGDVDILLGSLYTSNALHVAIIRQHM